MLQNTPQPTICHCLAFHFQWENTSPIKDVQIFLWEDHTAVAIPGDWWPNAHHKRSCLQKLQTKRKILQQGGSGVELNSKKIQIFSHLFSFIQTIFFFLLCFELAPAHFSPETPCYLLISFHRSATQVAPYFTSFLHILCQAQLYELCVTWGKWLKTEPTIWGGGGSTLWGRRRLL